MMRLFIGIRPDAQACDALARTAELLRPLMPGRYVEPTHYHLTLAFLGEQEALALAEIASAMHAAVRDAQPFPLSLAGTGTFGAVLWRGVTPEAALRILAERLRASLEEAGVSFDARPFRAHITLAREAQTTLYTQGAAPLPEAEFIPQTLTLFESVRRHGRLQYLPRLEVPLGQSVSL